MKQIDTFTALKRGVLTAAASLFLMACAGPKAQFFVFPENLHVYHDQNVIRGIFPGWDLDISIMSPQGEYLYNTCEYCHDWNYYLTVMPVFRTDSNSVWNLESRWWLALRPVTAPNRITIDSARITVWPKGTIRVLHIDTSEFVESPEVFQPGVHYKFEKFKIPDKSDSLRLQFEAYLTDTLLTPIDSISVDTVLYRWVHPPKQRLAVTEHDK